MADLKVIARYSHPQGSTIEVYDNGAIVKLSPQGKQVKTSATAEKLARGHGGWTPITDGQPVPVMTMPTQSQQAVGKTLLPMKFRETPVSTLPNFVTDPTWVLQQKVDGVRAQLIMEPGNTPWFRNGTGGQLASAVAAATTNPLLRRLPGHPPHAAAGYTVDGEVLDGAFWIFDFIKDGGERLPLSDRLDLLEAWHAEIAKLGLDDIVKLLPTARTLDEKNRLAKVVYEQGGEGWIAKHLNGAYDYGQRVEHSLKLKITHTVDCVVLERNREGKSNMALALYDNGTLREVGCASAIGKPNAAVGDVVEVKYLYTGADGRLVQPTILRIRTDKPEDQCDVAQLRFADKSVVT